MPSKAPQFELTWNASVSPWPPTVKTPSHWSYLKAGAEEGLVHLEPAASNLLAREVVIDMVAGAGPAEGSVHRRRRRSIQRELKRLAQGFWDDAITVHCTKEDCFKR